MLDSAGALSKNCGMDRYLSIRLPLFLPIMFIFVGCGKAMEPRSTRRADALQSLAAKLTSHHKPLGAPGFNDWLANHKESGQTFDEYIRADPVTPNGARRVIYIQPIGPFSKSQHKIIDLSAKYLGIYFDRPVKVLENLPLKIIPKDARRKHPDWGMEQILTTHVLHKVLRPKLPADAAAYIAFTATDLWPGKGWNFVFGQASLRNRVGVWSIYRNGDPDDSDAAFRLCLRRTLKTATHETGHMFSIKHCIAYECNMCGSNHRDESDRHPLHLCPECVAKVCWATGARPIERYNRLADFCEQHGLDDEAEFFRRSIATLENPSPDD